MKFYVYVLFRPWDGSPCYVGKGKGGRWLSNANDGKYNRHLAFIVKKARKLGLEIPRIKARENLSELEAFETEAALIAAIGREKTGPLVNLTAGGDGGFDPSSETRSKMSAAATERANRPEERARISALHKGKTIPPETRAAMSATHIKIGVTPKQLEALHAARKNRGPATVETRAKMSATVRKRNLGAEYSSNHKAAIRAGVSAFWQARREAGLPLKHSRRKNQ